MIESVDFSILVCTECTSNISCSHHVSNKSEIKTLLKALSTNGFIQICNHNIDESVILNAVQSSKEFFSLNHDQKMLHESKDKARRGYSPISSENFASLAGASNKPNDTVEKYRIGPIVSESIKILNLEYYDSKEARVHFFENDWKDLDQEFIYNMKSYYEVMTNLSAKLLSIIETAVGLTPGFFERVLDKQTSIMSLNYYPPLSRINTNVSTTTRVAEHTDVSMLTIVYQTTDTVDQNIGGLEVFDATRNEWLKVPYTPNAFVVNVGDCLSDWSQGLFKSSMHRVLMNDTEESSHRYSMAYFCTPNYDAELIWPVDKEESSATITYSTWRKNRIKRAIQMLKKGKQ